LIGQFSFKAKDWSHQRGIINLVDFGRIGFTSLVNGRVWKELDPSEGGSLIWVRIYQKIIQILRMNFDDYSSSCSSDPDFKRAEDRRVVFVN